MTLLEPCTTSLVLGGATKLNGHPMLNGLNLSIFMNLRFNTTTTPLNYYDIEKDIQEALKFMSTQEKPKVTDVVRLFDVQRKRLEARIKGRGTCGKQAPTNQRLSNIQIKALKL
ncbi:hypothetical protein EJ02DRAFT_453647 [Clathrospora elynae]|uniref:Uncharacterized protein n=1 Tax=Clathrospora elynae TaxID=706981 RepID=A0A6A5SR42_9PLEO|nr:hypothetical protein EJ02DRAFT_453647 [Clathrospora elynae]